KEATHPERVPEVQGRSRSFPRTGRSFTACGAFSEENAERRRRGRRRRGAGPREETATISGGSVTGGGGVDLFVGSVAPISGGTVTGRAAAGETYGVAVEFDGSATIPGGTVTAGPGGPRAPIGRAPATRAAARLPP